MVSSMGLGSLQMPFRRKKWASESWRWKRQDPQPLYYYFKYAWYIFSTNWLILERIKGSLYLLRWSYEWHVHWIINKMQSTRWDHMQKNLHVSVCSCVSSFNKASTFCLAARRWFSVFYLPIRLRARLFNLKIWLLARIFYERIVNEVLTIAHRKRETLKDCSLKSTIL